MLNRLYKRRFLNKKLGIAAIEIDHRTDQSGYTGVFAINDCNRTVRLDLDHWNRETRRNAVDKLQAVIDMAQELKAAIEATPAKYK